MTTKINQLVAQYPKRYQSQIQEIFEIRQRINDLMAQQGKTIRVTLERQDEKLKGDNYHVAPTDNYSQKTRDGVIIQHVESLRRIYKRRGGK